MSLRKSSYQSIIFYIAAFVALIACVSILSPPIQHSVSISDLKSALEKTCEGFLIVGFFGVIIGGAFLIKGAYYSFLEKKFSDGIAKIVFAIGPILYLGFVVFATTFGKHINTSQKVLAGYNTILSLTAFWLCTTGLLIFLAGRTYRFIVLFKLEMAERKALKMYENTLREHP